HHAVVPVVEAHTAWGFLDVGELGRAVFEHDAGLELFDHFFGDFATHAHRVLAVHLVGGVHQAVGQLAVSGEHQQPSGVDVQAADVDPAAFFQARQAVEYGRAAFRVVAGADFAIRFVVEDDPAHVFAGLFALDQAA